MSVMVMMSGRQLWSTRWPRQYRFSLPIVRSSATRAAHETLDNKLALDVIIFTGQSAHGAATRSRQPAKT